MSTPTQTFYPFPRLPIKLQIEIFEFAASSDEGSFYRDGFMFVTFAGLLRSAAYPLLHGQRLAKSFFFTLPRCWSFKTCGFLAHTCHMTRQIALASWRREVLAIKDRGLYRLAEKDQEVKENIVAIFDGLTVEVRGRLGQQ